MECSILKRLMIEEENLDTYRSLARFHYRDEAIPVATRVYAIRDMHPFRERYRDPAGVIVYGMPTANLALRSKALPEPLARLRDNRERLQWINTNIRTIRRVVIDPRYRGLGLATRLVRETIDRQETPIVEALAVMGHVHPFFERAGMQRYIGAPSPAARRMVAVLAGMGIAGPMLLDPRQAHARLESLPADFQEIVDKEMRRFLKSDVRRRNTPPGPDRTRHVLSRLGETPVYYVYRRQNPEYRSQESEDRRQETELSCRA